LALASEKQRRVSWDTNLSRAAIALEDISIFTLAFFQPGNIFKILPALPQGLQAD
jgi:hypothetical protein